MNSFCLDRIRRRKDDNSRFDPDSSIKTCFSRYPPSDFFLVPLETTNLEVITTRKLSFNQFPLKS